MGNAKIERLTSISKAKSIEEMGDYWDTHSLADHREETREVSFAVRATQRRRIPIDPEVYSQIEAMARQRGISVETLVNLWIVEHLEKGPKTQHPIQRGSRSHAAG